MKKLLLLLIPVYCFGQTGYDPKPVKTWFKDTVLMTKQLKINSTGGAIIGGYNKNADAILELSSTTKTFLPPRMTAVQRLAISPTAGAVVYDTDSSKICYYNGSWICLSNTGGSGGVTTNGNGTTINGTAVDLRGNLNRAATDLKFNFTNQSLSLVDTSVNAYSFGIGNVDADGVARMLGNMQSAELLATDNVLLSSGLTADGNTYILGEDKQWLLVATTNYNHSNVIIDTSGIALRSGSTVTANKKLYFDLNKVSSDAIRMGVGIGTMFDSATSQVWMDYSLDSGSVWRGKDVSTPIITLKDSAEDIVFRAYADGSLLIRDGNEGNGKVLTSNAAGLASWQTASGGGWGLTGNAGTVEATNFVGTTDAIGLSFRTSNTIRAAIDRNGRANIGGIGSTTPTILPMLSVTKDTASDTWVSVTNASTTGTAGFYIGSEPNTTHGTIPANSHYGYIGIATQVYTGADTVFNHHLNLVSGSGNYEGINIFSDNGGIDFFTEGAAAGATMSIVSGTDSAASSMPNAGYVGIGTKRPQRPLTVYNTSPAIALQSSTTGATSSDGAVILGGGALDIINYENSYTTFWTNAVERMRILADGSGVGINVTAPIRQLQVHALSTSSGVAITNTTTGSGSGNGFQFVADGNDGYIQQSENAPIYVNMNGGTRQEWSAAGAIKWNNYGAGTITADASGNLTSVSDERLKKIKGVYKSGLKELLGVEPIIYKWNEKSGLEQKYNYAGFSAQNVKENIPLGTGENSEGYLSLQDRAILATLVNAVKELSAEIEKLKKK